MMQRWAVRETNQIVHGNCSPHESRMRGPQYEEASGCDPFGRTKGAAGLGANALETAVSLLRSGEALKAMQICQEILAREPHQQDAWHLLGMGALARRCIPEALSYFSRAISISPDRLEFHNDIGLAWMAAGRFDMALPSFHRVLSIKPEMVSAQYNLALAHKGAGDLMSAVDAYHATLRIDPGHAKAHFGLGDLLLTNKDLPGAERHLRAAIEIDPAYIAAYNHLGICLVEQQRFDDARRAYHTCIRIAPDCAQTYCNLGNLERMARNFDEALRNYRSAIRLKPEFTEAHFNLSLVLLMLEDFLSGWREYEWRLRYFEKNSGYPYRYGLPLWQGQPLHGKTILVYDEQGFGDVFMFSRYLSRLKSEGARVIFETRRELFDLFKQLPCIDETKLRSQNEPPSSQCDYCIPLLSLPGRFETNRETICDEAPYLFADTRRKLQWSSRMSSESVKIGLVWRGSEADPSRRCGLDKLQRLTCLPGIKWYGLQKGDIGTSRNDSQWMVNLGTELKDFSDTAAVIANLDLVISIDTAVAHLAGAMAKPVWVLLPYVADWRWFLDETATPWYSSMRLFRQSKAGDWDGPIRHILETLQREYCSGGK